MLTIYWLCFAVGGVFVLLAILSGMDGADVGEPDFEAPDFDTNIDQDIEIRDMKERSPDRLFVARRPSRNGIFGFVKSLKFWTFGICFFGLTGLVLSNLTMPLPAGLIAIVAVVMGSICGALVSGTLQILRRQQADSLIRVDDLVGSTGTVEVPFDKDSRGKVQLLVKGSMIQMIAYTDAVQALEKGDPVLVVGTEQNRLWVVPAETTKTL